MALLLDDLKGRKIYNLEQPRYNGQPAYPSHRPAYNYFISRNHADSYFPDKKGPRTTAQGFMIMGDHSGTHMDAMCHQALDLVMHGGVLSNNSVATPSGYTKLGAEELKPTISRGVLLDVPRYKGVDILEHRYSITAEDLENTAKMEGVELQEGDTVLVRTGYDTMWRNTDEYLQYAGVGISGSKWVEQFKPSLFGADQMSWDIPEEKDEEVGSTHWAHIHLMVQQGITMIENMKLDELAKDQQYVFTFVCYPMKFEGATGTPVVPLAIV